MIRDTGPVSFANSIPRLSSTKVISFHSWTSLHPVWWSEAGWLSHPPASSRSVPAATMLAASRRLQWWFSETSPAGPSTAQIFLLHPRKQRPSSQLCVSLWSDEFLERRSTARPFSIQRVSCVRRKWLGRTPREVDPSLVSATPSTACALRRHLISFLARRCRLTRREASCVWDGTLYSSSIKESSRMKARSATTEGRAGQIYRAVDLQRPAEAPLTHWSDVRGHMAGNQ